MSALTQRGFRGESWSGQCECPRFLTVDDGRGTIGTGARLSQLGSWPLPGLCWDLSHSTPAWASFTSCAKGESLNSNSKTHECSISQKGFICVS